MKIGVIGQRHRSRLHGACVHAFAGRMGALLLHFPKILATGDSLRLSIDLEAVSVLVAKTTGRQCVRRSRRLVCAFS